MLPDEPVSSSVEALLSVQDLRVSVRDRFGNRAEVVKGIDFELRDDEVLAVLGETGSGKTALIESLTRLGDGAKCRGRVHLRGHRGNLLRKSSRSLGKVRGGQISYVFGGMRAALHSHVSIRDQMKEVLNRHRPQVKDEDEEIVYWLSKVGIAEPEPSMRLFPWKLGLLNRIRVGVALGMCTLPQVIVADEPAAGLDQSGQDEILRLIRELKARVGVAMLLTTRDFRVVHKLANRVAVLEAGTIVETGDLATVTEFPKHELTRRLLDVTPGMGNGEIEYDI